MSPSVMSFVSFVLAADSGSGSRILLIGAAVLAVGWILSLYLHPYTACSRCKSSPRRFGSIYTKAFGLCPACKGSGRRLRWGVRTFTDRQS